MTKLPLPPVFVEQYLKKMQHKVSLNERVLSRNHSASLDKIMGLVRAILDWHLNTQSSFELPALLSPVLLRRDGSNGPLGKRRGSGASRPGSAGSKHSKKGYTTTFSRKTSVSRLTTGRKSVQPGRESKEAESEKLSKFA